MVMHVSIIRAVQQSIILLFTYLILIQVFIHYRSYKQETHISKWLLSFSYSNIIVGHKYPSPAQG